MGWTPGTAKRPLKKPASALPLAPATGALGNASTAPKARVSYTASYFDKGNRLTAAVDVGTTTIRNYLRGINMDGYAAITARCTEVAPAPLLPAQPMFQFDLQLNFPQLTGFTLLPMPRPGGGPSNYVALHNKATMRGVE